MRHLTIPLGVLLAAATLCAQGGQEKVTFEVASVHPSAPPAGGRIRVGCQGGPGRGDPGRLTCSNMDLVNLVTMAYDMRRYQVTAPDWMGTERYDITAKIPEGATKEQVSLMLQNLLAERFKFAFHHEKKEMPIYQLLVAKGGPKLKDAEELPPAGDAPGPPPGPPGPPKMDADGFPILPTGTRGASIMMNGKARMMMPSQTMEQVAMMLSNQVGRPVTNGTDLKGKYDISLYFAMDRMGPMGGPIPPPPPPTGGGAGPTEARASDDSGPNIFAAIQEQLGLRLESKKGPVDILVVDHAEKTPIEN